MGKTYRNEKNETKRDKYSRKSRRKNSGKRILNEEERQWESDIKRWHVLDEDNDTPEADEEYLAYLRYTGKLESNERLSDWVRKRRSY